LCALDLRKAFDKLNHFGLFIKLMDRAIPISILSVIEHWSVSSLIVFRQKFLTKFMNIDNSVCSSVLGCARRDLNDFI